MAFVVVFSSLMNKVACIRTGRFEHLGMALYDIFSLSFLVKIIIRSQILL